MQPLTGVRVLDLSRLLPGPVATMVLGDMGAEIDKIEDPHGGDYVRNAPPAASPKGGDSVLFGTLNRGKRSAVLDLKAPRGADAFREILPRYDVLFEQFRPGVLARLGLSPATLREKHPRLIVCSLTGYGQTGPLAQKAGHDLNYLARAGLLGATGPSEGAPTPPGYQLADVGGALWSVIAILGALREREQTGKGAHLDIAMSEATLPFAIASIAPALAGVSIRPGGETLTGGIGPYATYATKDGRAVALAALEPKFWMTFAAHVGHAPSLEDLVPGPHQAPLKAKLAAAFAERTLAEWLAWNEGKDCMLEPVLTPEEATRDAHLVARGMFFEIDSPRGTFPQVRTPVTPREPAIAPPPAAGEHTRAILTDGGLSVDAIDALLRANVARASDLA